MRFVDADLFYRENLIKEFRNSGVANGSMKHLGRTVREYPRLDPILFKAPEHPRNFWEGVECPVGVHQPFAEACSLKPELLQSVVQSSARHLPEVCVFVLNRAEPSILKLFLPPKAVERLEFATQYVTAALRSRRVVEESTVCVKDARTGHMTMQVVHNPLFSPGIRSRLRVVRRARPHAACGSAGRRRPSVYGGQ